MLSDLLDNHFAETLRCRDIALTRCLDDPSRTSVIVKTKQHYVSNCDVVENNYLPITRFCVGGETTLRWGRNDFELGAKRPVTENYCALSNLHIESTNSSDPPKNKCCSYNRDLEGIRKSVKKLEDRMQNNFKSPH